MSQVIVLTFNDQDQAGEVRESLRRLEKDGQLELDDVVVVVKDEDGKLSTKDELDRGVKVGAAGGGLLGILIGGIIFPISGLLIGLAGGALAGKVFGGGIDKKFVKEVQEALQPGSSAIFLVVRDSNREVAIAALRQYEGNIYHTSVDARTEEALKNALE
jgi:uncharacterized membrane protein